MPKSPFLKITTIMLLLVAGMKQSHAQTLTYDDFKSLLPHLRTEDWQSAYTHSGKLLKAADTDTSEFRAIILYIHLFSAAGMVVTEQMSYHKLRKNVLKYKGQKIIMAAHPVTTKPGALRQTSFDLTDSTNSAFTCATNAKGTTILCFENFTFSNKIDPADFPERALVRCGGTLDTIETNPNQSLLWILRLTVKDAFARRAD